MPIMKHILDYIFSGEVSLEVLKSRVTCTDFRRGKHESLSPPTSPVVPHPPLCLTTCICVCLFVICTDHFE